MPKEIDCLVKIRDGLAMAAEGINDWLETLAPPGTSPTGLSYDVNKIQGQRTEGPKGIYDKITDDKSLDYQGLLKDLQAHKGRMNVDGAFYWLWDDGKTIGRKPRGSK